MWKQPISDLVTTKPLWRKLRIHLTLDENPVDVQDAETSERLEKTTAAMNAVYRTLKRCSHMWNVTILELKLIGIHCIDLEHLETECGQNHHEYTLNRLRLMTLCDIQYLLQ